MGKNGNEKERVTVSPDYFMLSLSSGNTHTLEMVKLKNKNYGMLSL